MGMEEKGSNAFKEMRREGIEPDGVSFISILSSCSHSGLVDEGWRFFNIMKHVQYRAYIGALCL